MIRLPRHPFHPRLTPKSALLGLALAALLGLVPEAGVAQRTGTLAHAQELIDAGEAEEAMKLLDGYLEKEPDDAEGLFLRSTARFMWGDQIRGRQDLERSLELDPARRQAWLNLGALHLASGRLPEALSAFEKARDLDPRAADNDMNIGAVLLFQGDVEAARRRFEAYKAVNRSSAEAHYLVASNFALAGYVSLALENLRKSVALDERLRLRARTDPNFGTVSTQRKFQAFFAEDPYRPPTGAHVERGRFPVAYEAGNARLLGAVVDTLQDLGLAFDPRIEVTPSWALIWGDLRIKVSSGEDGEGLVELSAPADRFTPETWRRRSEDLLAGIADRLRR